MTIDSEKSIFINYRRDDSAGYVIALYHYLTTRRGRIKEDNFFLDLHSIDLGNKWEQTIDEALDQCRIFLAVIGKWWLNIADSNGDRRLDNPEDFVRREIAKALKRGITVIPVLVGDTKMPKAIDLPEDIQKLTASQACFISDRNFYNDAKQLRKSLRDLLTLQLERKTDEGRYLLDDTDVIDQFEMVRDTFRHSVFGVQRLENFVEYIRIPRLKLNTIEEPASDLYPYYGSSGIISHKPTYQLDEHHILISKIGLNLLSRGHSIFKPEKPFSVNGRVHILRARDGVLLEYLLYTLILEDFSRFIIGSAQPYLSWDTLKDILISVPPYDIQAKIVEAIQDAMKNNPLKLTRFKIIEDVLKTYNVI